MIRDRYYRKIRDEIDRSPYRDKVNFGRDWL